MGTYRLYPSTNGPSAATAYSGPYEAGVPFLVTSGGTWLTGYWWWVCNSGQQTTAVKFGLWQVLDATHGAAVPGSVVTSGTLTAGAWNYVPLATPLALSINTVYMAANGYTSTTGFPETDNQFGVGQPFANGITNGPLFTYGGSSTLPPGTYTGNNVFDSAHSDPATNMPVNAFNNANFWMDVQVTDVAPTGASYRLWPNLPSPVAQTLDTANNFTLGTEFQLGTPCALNKIWYYSPATVTQLPTECAIYSVSSLNIVAGTDNAAPAWSGAAGSGWVSCSYAGNTILPPGKYKVVTFNGAGTPAIWNMSYLTYWASGKPGGNGITAGPLTGLSLANADAPGQSTYHLGTPIHYPDTFDGSNPGDNYWVDVEVTPVASGAGFLMAQFP